AVRDNYTLWMSTGTEMSCALDYALPLCDSSFVVVGGTLTWVKPGRMPAGTRPSARPAVGDRSDASVAQDVVGEFVQDRRLQDLQVAAVDPEHALVLQPPQHPAHGPGAQAQDVGDHESGPRQAHARGRV